MGDDSLCSYRTAGNLISDPGSCLRASSATKTRPPVGFVTDCDSACHAGRSFRHAGEALSSDIVHSANLCVQTTANTSHGWTPAAATNTERRSSALPSSTSTRRRRGWQSTSCPRCHRPCWRTGHAGRSFAPDLGALTARGSSACGLCLKHLAFPRNLVCHGVAGRPRSP